MAWLLFILGVSVVVLIGCLVRLARLNKKLAYIDEKIAGEYKKKDKIEQEIASLEAQIAVREKFARFTQQAQGTPPPPVFTKPEHEQAP